MIRHSFNTKIYGQNTVGYNLMYWPMLCLLIYTVPLKKNLNKLQNKRNNVNNNHVMANNVCKIRHNVDRYGIISMKKKKAQMYHTI